MVGVHGLRGGRGGEGLGGGSGGGERDDGRVGIKLWLGDGKGVLRCVRLGVGGFVSVALLGGEFGPKMEEE